MKTRKINTFSFEELSEKAKQKVIESLSTINVDFDWWENTYEDAKNIGLKITSFDLDRNRHAKGEFLLSANEVAANIVNAHGIGCNTFDTANKFLEEWQPVFNNYMDKTSEDYESQELENKLQEIEEEFLNNLLEDYSIILQNECEYLQSEEAIKETISANQYEFTEEGKLYNF